MSTEPKKKLDTTNVRFIKKNTVDAIINHYKRYIVYLCENETNCGYTIANMISEIDIHTKKDAILIGVMAGLLQKGISFTKKVIDVLKTYVEIQTDIDKIMPIWTSMIYDYKRRDVRMWFRNIKKITNIIKDMSCIKVVKEIGRGMGGTAYEIIVGRGARLVMKLETNKSIDLNSIEREFAFMNACSQLIQTSVCINMVLVYGMFKLNRTKHDRSENTRLSLMPSRSGKITYGIVMEKTDLTAQQLLQMKTRPSITVLNEIFWQIAMALYACRKHLGMFHNDIHTGNIFLTRVSKPVNIVYVNGGKKRRILVTEYFATLGDYGLAHSDPYVFHNDTLLYDVCFNSNFGYQNGANYVSDFNRLITTLYNGVLDYSNNHFFSELWRTWNGLKTEIKKLTYNDDQVPLFQDVEDNVPVLKNDRIITGLYKSELETFIKHAFNDDAYKEYHDSNPKNSIMCDITPPRELLKITETKECRPDIEKCFWWGDVRGTSDTIRICKNRKYDTRGLSKDENLFDISRSKSKSKTRTKRIFDSESKY